MSIITNPETNQQTEKAARRPFWLLKEWWQYVLDDSRCPDKNYGDDELLPRWLQRRPLSLWAAYIFRCQCRARNHPYGVHWYNVGGTEPDMDCRGCGEDLG